MKLKGIGIIFFLSLAFLFGIVWQKASLVTKQNNQKPATNNANIVKTKLTPTTTINPKTKASVTSAPKDQTQQEGWKKVKSWNGNGITTTEQFAITGKQWRINYTLQASQFDSALLQVYVYDTQKDYPVEVPVNTTDTGSGTSYVYKNGNFYLKISGMESWTVEVEELI